jgi:hypothetical protein
MRTSTLPVATPVARCCPLQRQHTCRCCLRGSRWVEAPAERSPAAAPAASNNRGWAVAPLQARITHALHQTKRGYLFNILKVGDSGRKCVV